MLFWPNVSKFCQHWEIIYKFLQVWVQASKAQFFPQNKNKAQGFTLESSFTDQS